MAEFVNYHKREVTLPAGCKNLIDVLKSQGEREWQNFLPELSGGIQSGGTFNAKLSEMTRFVTMAYQSRGWFFNLVVSPPDERISFEVSVLRDCIRSASVLVPVGTGVETSVRRFFANHGLSLPGEEQPVAKFYAEAPVYLICRIEPMPPDPSTLGKFAIDLFREVCGLSDDAELTYRHDELLQPA